MNQNKSEYFIIGEERSFLYGLLYLIFICLSILSLNVLMVLMDFESPFKSIKIGLGFLVAIYRNIYYE